MFYLKINLKKFKTKRDSNSSIIAGEKSPISETN